MDIALVFWTFLFFAGGVFVGGAEYAFHRDSTPYAAVTLFGLFLVVLTVRQLLMNPVTARVPSGTELLAAALIQIGIGFAVYVGVQRLMQRIGGRTRDRAVQ